MVNPSFLQSCLFIAGHAHGSPLHPLYAVSVSPRAPGSHGIPQIKANIQKGVLVPDPHLSTHLVFHQGCLPLKVIFHQKLSSIKGCLTSKVILLQRSSSIKGRIPWKVVFHQRLTSVEAHLPLKVVFN